VYDEEEVLRIEPGRCLKNVKARRRHDDLVRDQPSTRRHRRGPLRRLRIAEIGSGAALSDKGGRGWGVDAASAKR
jgi:hypothetical protein